MSYRRKSLKSILRFRRSIPPVIHHSELEPLPDFTPNLNYNLFHMKDTFADCSDIVFHSFRIGGQTEAVLIYIDGLTDTELLDQQVLTPLKESSVCDQDMEDILRHIAVSSKKSVQSLTDAAEEITAGNSVLIIDQLTNGLSFGLTKWEKRSIEEPSAESVVRGPREGFVESIRDNTAMLRRKIKSPHLKMKTWNIGHYSQTRVIVAYMEGIADPVLIEEIANRLQRIDIDAILDSEYIEEMIEDHPYSPFPQFLKTERPDVAGANLMEGRVVILVDGTPMSLVAPVTFFSLLQSPEDYYQRYWISTAIRWLRYLFLLVALLGPSFYVAIVSFHQEMIPTTLVLTMATSRAQVPFPALVEAILMEITFEALREASARLPKQVGAAVSIVGGLVIGQAAIQAGLVSSPMVIVVAITGIASFLIPDYSTGASVRLLRFPIIALSGFLGLFGLLLGVILLLIHLLSLRSLGVPYLEPLAPLKTRQLGDVLVKSPIWENQVRPHLTGKWNKYRQGTDQQPDPSNGDEQA